MSRRYHYEIGAVRWYRWNPKDGDVRGARVADGWKAMAEMRDDHPTTGQPFKQNEWWVREEFTGGG